MHFPPKFPQKRSPPTFSMVHLLHRLYGVDAPGQKIVSGGELCPPDTDTLNRHLPPTLAVRSYNSLPPEKKLKFCAHKFDARHSTCE